MVVVGSVAGDVLEHLDERRQLDGLAFLDAFCLEDNETLEGVLICVYLKVLSLPDETAAVLADGALVGVGKAEHHLVEAIVDLALGDEFLGGRDALLGRVDIHILALPAATTQAHLGARLGAAQVGLDDVDVDGVGRQFAVNLDDVFALQFDGLRQAEHAADFLEHALHLGVKVIVVVNHAQVGVSGPSLDNLLVERAGDVQAFLCHRLVALGIVGRGVVLLGAIGGAHQVQHGVIALAQFGAAGAHGTGDVVPHLGCHIGRDVERAPVTDDDARLGTFLGHTVEFILEGKLDFESRFLALIEVFLVGGQVVHAGGGEHGGHLGQGEHLVSHAGEMLDYLGQCRRLAGARSSGEDDASDICHFIALN